MRPKDAATLIIVRKDHSVLLGRRNAKHLFMPHRYVFPGGSVDAGDARVPCPVPMAKSVEQQLCRSVSAPRARAIAMAAVRETFEETGLILGRRRDPAPASRSPHWQPFFDTGFVPALDHLQYFARAITPPRMVRRFDARFFVCHAEYLSGDLAGNGELLHLHWVKLARASSLPLAPITQLVLELLAQHLDRGKTKTTEAALYRELAGKELLELHWPAL